MEVFYLTSLRKKSFTSKGKDGGRLAVRVLAAREIARPVLVGSLKQR
ncbi:hypothetical protein [Bacillus xiapuensis]|nr:hypothetical protein [Bacillus xiapuensis]